MDKEEMLRRIDPELRDCYAAMQPYSLAYDALRAIRAYSISQFRRAPSAFAGRGDICLKLITIDGADHMPLELRVYEPLPRGEALPVILYFHGGGGVMSSAEQDDPFCMELALRERCLVVSVEYRLAPEHPAPAGQLDCYAAWKWLCAEGAQRFNADLSRSAFYGGSGGGNMALGTALRLLDQGERLPTVLLPLYPMIDERGVTPSSREITDESLWGRTQNQQAWDYCLHGLGGVKTEAPGPYTAPVHREDFSGLPPVLSFVGALDLFRDETLELVQKLARCGVPVEFTLYPGCYHGFEVWVPGAEVSQRARRSIHEFLQRAFSC